MSVTRRFSCGVGTLAAIFAVAALAYGAFAGIARAETAGAGQPRQPLSLDPTALPQLPAAGDANKFKPSESGESALKIPDGIQFGDHLLQFETKREATTPRVGAEAVEPTVINKTAPQESPLKPDYFGLKFSIPIQR